MVDRDPTAAIAQRLKRERLQRRWSLEDLARETGVSKAMLSKLERGAASPTASLLGKISGGLGVSISSLLLEPSEPGARLVRRADQALWQDPATHYVRRQVSPLNDAALQIVEIELPPGKRVGFPAAAYVFVRHLIWLLAGTLEFTEGAQRHRLQAGDCLELGPPADCVYRNPGKSPCRYAVVLARRG